MTEINAPVHDPRILRKLRALTHQAMPLDPGYANSVGDHLFDTENVDRGYHEWGAGILTEEGRKVAEDLRAGLAEGARFMETCESPDGLVDSTTAWDYRTLFVVSETALDSALRGEPDATDGKVAMAVSMLLSEALERSQSSGPRPAADEEEAEAAVPDPAP